MEAAPEAPDRTAQISKTAVIVSGIRLRRGKRLAREVKEVERPRVATEATGGVPFWYGS